MHSIHGPAGRDYLIDRYGRCAADWVLARSHLSGADGQPVIELDHADLLVAEHRAICRDRGCCDCD